MGQGGGVYFVERFNGKGVGVFSSVIYTGWKGYRLFSSVIYKGWRGKGHSAVNNKVHGGRIQQSSTGGMERDTQQCSI